MLVPTETRELLAPFMAPDFPWGGVEITLASLDNLPPDQPHTVFPLAVRRVTRRGRARGLQVVGMTVGRHVFLDPRFGDLNTAAGLALAAHEFEHVAQNDTIPDFEARYNEEARHTPDSRPWENAYELAAYRREQEVYCDLVARGVPPGRWVPLSVQLWGCTPETTTLLQARFARR